MKKPGYIGDGFVDPAEAFVDGNALFLGMEPAWSCGAPRKEKFNADLSAMLRGGEESLPAGPLYGGASFTQLRESYYYPTETILDGFGKNQEIHKRRQL